jgi:hypothetical protein
MFKRILDGNGIWLSDKIARVEPVWCRPEYAWIYPIASGNGTFEHNLPKIFGLCYCRRPDMTMEKLEVILAAFERERLIFKWFDKATDKHWGFFTGSRKPGRCPPASRVEKGHELVGPEPPAEALAKFLTQLSSASASAPAIVANVPSKESAHPVWAAIGARVPFGTQQFQETIEFYFETRADLRVSEALEQAIQRCQKRKLPIPPQLYTLKHAVEETEGSVQPALTSQAAAPARITVRDIRPRER